jgi:hypothetical protein
MLSLYLTLLTGMLDIAATPRLYILLQGSENLSPLCSQPIEQQDDRQANQLCSLSIHAGLETGTLIL